MNSMEIQFSTEAPDLPQAGDMREKAGLPSESDVRLFLESMDGDTPPRGSGDASPDQRAGTLEAFLPRADGSSPCADEIPPHAPAKEGSGMKIETELEDIFLRRMNEASGMAHGTAVRSTDSGAGCAAAAERNEWKDGSAERNGQGTVDADQDDGIQRSAPMSVQDMFRGAMSPVDAMFAGSVEQASPAPGPDMELLENVVERILVSAPEQGGQEVRISIHSDALRSTEITIRRDAEGRLTVGMNSADQATFQTLVSAQGELKKILETSEKAEVRVSVTGDTRDAHPEQNDSRQRSRGYFAQYGQDEQ